MLYFRLLPLIRHVMHAKTKFNIMWGQPWTGLSAVARWTKVGPCVDFWLRGQVFLCVPWYLQLVAEALRFNDAAAADATARPAGDRCDFDASKYTDIAAAAKEDFLVVAGRCLQRAQQLLREPQHRARLAVLAMVMVPQSKGCTCSQSRSQKTTDAMACVGSCMGKRGEADARGRAAPPAGRRAP
jgi:hypothetical protein